MGRLIEHWPRVTPARKTARKAQAKRPQPAPEGYPPGHFTALLRQHHWPPRFTPMFKRTRELEMSELMRAHRERRVELGDTGTILGLSDKSELGRLLRRQTVTAMLARVADAAR